MNVSIRSWLSNQAFDQEMEYWKTTRSLVQDVSTFSQCKKTFIKYHFQALRREFDNQFNTFAVKLLNSEEMVGHLPAEYSRIAWYFHARGGSISVEVSSHCRHCKQLCDGMEIPCQVTFTCSSKTMLNRSKAFFNKKGLIIM